VGIERAQTGGIFAMRTKSNRRKGAVLAEFGPAMVVFVCFLIVPLIDISFIPVRYFIAQGVINNTAQRLCLAEKRSEANTLAHGTWWTHFLTTCGVDVNPKPVKLIVCGKNDADKLVLEPGQQVPDEWLPQGEKGPCVYLIELTVDAAIPPLYKYNAGLPGFTGPIHVTMSGRANWENLGRNPETKKYYINE
jgi:hypothetical protein